VAGWSKLGERSSGGRHGKAGRSRKAGSNLAIEPAFVYRFASLAGPGEAIVRCAAMPTPIDPKRLPSLKAALDTFGDDDKVGHKDLAKLYGVTPARLTTLIHTRFESFPEPERHGDKSHWYLARPALLSMIAYLQGAGKAKRQVAARAAAVMGRAAGAAADAEPEEEEPKPMGPVELDRLASAATRIWRLGVEQKKFVPADTLRHWARGTFELVKREVSSIPHAIDPNGELPALHRARLNSTCRELLLNLTDKLEALLKECAPEAETGEGA
jgi:hypothetical protein